MLAYQLKLAFRSLRRTPMLTALTVGGIALGIAVSMTFVTMYYFVAGDPIPHKSDRLFYVQLDAWDPDDPYDDDKPEDPPDQLTHRDAMAMMESDIPTYKAAMYKTAMVLHPPAGEQRPFRESVRLTFADFFTMFDTPFLFGAGWSAEDDAGPAAKVVLGRETNDRVFGGENSVGRTLQIEDREFVVAGVLDHWAPAPKFYDPLNGSFNDVEAIYLPFRWGEELEIDTTGNTSSWEGWDGRFYSAKLQSEAVWIQFWVQLDDDAEREAFRAYMDAYANDQKAAGRFQRPLNNRLRDVHAWLVFNEVVAPENRTMAIIAILFLLICSVNLIGVLLGKFLARAPEVGVRRALGATRRWVFVQHLIECEVIGLLGCGIGLVLAHFGTGLLERLFEVNLGAFVDPTMIATGVALAALAALVAGVYPAWKICRIAPGMHLKTQ